MSLNFQEIFSKIKSIGAHTKERELVLNQRRSLARTLFDAYATQLDVMHSKVETLRQQDAAIRCAVPREALNAHHPTPVLPAHATLIAADGSQISPDRHASAQYGVVNVGAIVMQLNTGQAPQVSVDSQLLYDEELLTPKGFPLSDGLIALKRDLDERSKLDELARQHAVNEVPVITFTDGPIELWGEKDGEDAEAYYESLNKYKSVLSRLQSRGVITAGYVDKPGANLVVRLLELMTYDQSESGDLRAHQPLRGVTDRWLFGDREHPVLGAGERSAVFRIQSKSEKHYQGVLALHFFYINVGSAQHPYPVRVEIPRWVADDDEKLNALHAVLVDQCRQMGSKPYPYLLHRAHEIAVVTMEERKQVEMMLNMEIRRNKGEVDDTSNKQSAKDREGRTGYKR